MIKDVINYRLNRNKLPVLNADMTVEYGIRIPPSNAPMLMNSFGGNSELDIEWIVSASSSSTSSSASLSNMSSARSQKSVFSEISNPSNSNNASNSIHRMINLNDNGMLSISTGSFKQRRPSGTKRLPWEDNDMLAQAAPINNFNGNQNNPNSQNTPKTNRMREAAPLKAFPLSDDPDFLAGNLYHMNKSKSGGAYPSSTSYQEKYLRKIQSDQQGNKLHQSKTDSNLGNYKVTLKWYWFMNHE